MHERVFVDTNLWIYLFLKSDYPEDREKRTLVKHLIQDYPTIIVSNQVMNEIANVLLRKYHIEQGRVEDYLRELLNIAECVFLDTRDTFGALHLLENYSLSFFDALIVSSARNATCRMLFSEDMQHGQTIEDTLTIRNPFKK